MYHIETEKYIIRRICEGDIEEVKVLLMENKYLSILWSSSLLSEERLEELIRNMYLNNETSYCVVNRKTGQFCGYMEIRPEDEEGELSIRLKEDADMYEIIELFGKVLKDIGSENKKNLTIQYSFE